MSLPQYGIPSHLRHRQILGNGKRRAIIVLGHHRALKVELKPTAHGKSPNQLEWNNFKRFFKNIPRELRPHIARISRQKKQNGRISHQTRMVRDFDGTISKSMHAVGKISNAFFWKSFQGMVVELVKARISFYDFTPKNILVKRVSEEKWIPVLVDFESMGAHASPWQFWLRLNFFSGMKVHRRADRLMHAYVSTAQSPKKPE